MKRPGLGPMSPRPPQGGGGVTPSRRALPDMDGWELAWIRSSLERSAAKMRADGFPGAVVQIETLLKRLPDTPNPPERV